MPPNEEKKEKELNKEFTSYETKKTGRIAHLREGGAFADSGDLASLDRTKKETSPSLEGRGEENDYSQVPLPTVGIEEENAHGGEEKRKAGGVRKHEV